MEQEIGQIFSSFLRRVMTDVFAIDMQPKSSNILLDRDKDCRYEWSGRYKISGTVDDFRIYGKWITIEFELS